MILGKLGTASRDWSSHPLLLLRALGAGPVHALGRLGRTECQLFVLHGNLEGSVQAEAKNRFLPNGGRRAKGSRRAYFRGPDATQIPMDSMAVTRRPGLKLTGHLTTRLVLLCPAQ